MSINIDKIRKKNQLATIRTQKLLLVTDKNWADLASRAEDMIGSNELDLNGTKDKLLKMIFENGSRNRIGKKLQKRTLKVRTSKNEAKNLSLASKCFKHSFKLKDPGNVEATGATKIQMSISSRA